MNKLKKEDIIFVDVKRAEGQRTNVFRLDYFKDKIELAEQFGKYKIIKIPKNIADELTGRTTLNEINSTDSESVMN